MVLSSIGASFFFEERIYKMMQKRLKISAADKGALIIVKDLLEKQPDDPPA